VIAKSPLLPAGDDKKPRPMGINGRGFSDEDDRGAAALVPQAI
jgi:hypothetical protein